MDDFNTKEMSVNSANKGDDFVIGEGFVLDESTYADDVAKHEKIKKRKRRKGVAAAIVRIVMIFVVSALLATAILIAGAEYLGIGPGRGHEVVLEIKQGASTQKIAEELKEVNAINSKLFFRLYSKLKGYDGKYQYGVYTFNNEIGYDTLTNLLLTEGASAESIRVTIPERASIDDIIKLLVDAGVCTRKDFINALDSERYDYDFVKAIPSEAVYYRFEGYLFPDTYDFYSYDSAECAELAIDKMLARMDEAITDDMRQKATDMGYSLHELITMASIVELEASGHPEEMKNVAQVFYNRLTDWENPLLGSSPTAKYKYGKGRYNTNTEPGIPPGPYCCPSAKALEAAFYPNTENKATYFVTDAKMNFYYTYSLQEHNQIIRKLKAEKNWIYEYYD